MIQPLDDNLLLERMRSLIGSRFTYLHRDWVLIEVLGNEGQLVLSALQGTAPIQPDQYGQPSRRVPENLTIPVFSQDGESLSEDAMMLLEQKHRSC